MELQKHEGGRTGGENETQYSLTFASCKMSSPERCFHCQPALLMSATTREKSSSQEDGSQEPGSTQRPKQSEGRGSNTRRAAHQHSILQGKVLQQTCCEEKESKEIHSACSIKAMSCSSAPLAPKAVTQMPQENINGCISNSAFTKGAKPKS